MDITSYQERQYSQLNSLHHILVLPGEDPFQRISSPFSAVTIDYINQFFSVKKVASSQINNTNSDNSHFLRCEVRILSRRKEPFIVCSFPDTYRKEADAIQNSALKVLNWFKVYFTQLYLLGDELHSFGIAPGECFKFYPKAILEEFSLWTSVFAKSLCNYPKPKRVLENGEVSLDNEGLDSGVIPTVGSVTSVSYEVWLVREGEGGKKYLVEKNEEFEVEVGSVAVICPMELCVTQLSVGQSAKFIVGPPPREVILAATHAAPYDISKIPLQNCWLEYAVKVLRVPTPMKERVETTPFSPALSKQRVEFAVRHINQSHALSLVLHQKLSRNCAMRACLRSAVLLRLKIKRRKNRSTVPYDGSIMDFDERLCNFDIGTCLEVKIGSSTTQATTTQHGQATSKTNKNRKKATGQRLHSQPQARPAQHKQDQQNRRKKTRHRSS